MSSWRSQKADRWATWLNFWTLLCLPAFGFAFIMWGALTTLHVSLAIAFITTLVLIGIPEGNGEEGESWRVKTAHTARVSLCATAAFLTVTMLAQVSGALWVLLLSLMVVTMPPSTAFLRRWLARLRNVSEKETEVLTSAQPAVQPPAGYEVRGLTDVELCCLWRHSFWDLEGAVSAEERFRIVAQRQQILDELTRRDPAAVDAWLASGARASSSPERFFEEGDSGQPAAA